VPTRFPRCQALARLDRSSAAPRQERLDLFFEARSWRGEVRNIEPARRDDLSWHLVDRLSATMLPLVRLVLADVARGVRHSAFTEEPE
jgi:hypothetical protein